VQTTVVIECTLVSASHSELFGHYLIQLDEVFRMICEYVNSEYFLFNFGRIAALSFSCVCFLVLNRYLLKLQCKQQIISN